MIADKYNSALLIVHHEHRPIRQKDGRAIDEGDNSIFGSFVWKAFSDHVLHFKRVNKGLNQMTCNTQRSSDIVEKIDLSYLGPEPMMFEIKTDVIPCMQVVLNNLDKVKFYSAKELSSKCGLGYSTVMSVFHKLKKDNLIERVGDGYPVTWRLK